MKHRLNLNIKDSNYTLLKEIFNINLWINELSFFRNCLFGNSNTSIL